MRATALEKFINIYPTVKRPILKNKHGQYGSPSEGQLFRICFASKTSMKWKPIPRKLITEQHSPANVSSKPSPGTKAPKQSKAATKELSTQVKTKRTANTHDKAGCSSATIVQPYFRLPFEHPLLVRLDASLPKRVKVVQCVETGRKASVIRSGEQSFVMLSVVPASNEKPTDRPINMTSLGQYGIKRGPCHHLY